MADTTPTTVDTDKVHQEGIDHIKSTLEQKKESEAAHQEGVSHIKDTLAERKDGETAAMTEPTAEDSRIAAAVSSPPLAETSTVEPIVAAEPPASNPGADDKTGGIAKGAGGLSGAAHKDIPNPATKEKRKSIFGSFKGYLGLDKKTEDQRQASDDTYLGAATAAATGAAAALGLTSSGQDTTTSTTATNNTTTSSATDAKPVALPETSSMDKNADSRPANAPSTDVVDKTHGNTKTEEQNPPGEKNAPDAGPANTGSTSGDSSDKPPKPVDNVAPENKSAIPSAGGEKLGEKHWGESKIVPDDPGKAKNDEAVSSAEGQPSKEVADNTAKNTGGAAPATSSTDAAHADAKGDKKEKGKFLDKLKDKLPMGKKKA